MTTVSLHSSQDTALPTRVRLSLWARLTAQLTARKDSRAFEKAIGRSYGSETGDLMALRRRD